MTLIDITWFTAEAGFEEPAFVFCIYDNKFCRTIIYGLQGIVECENYDG